METMAKVVAAGMLATGLVGIAAATHPSGAPSTPVQRAQCQSARQLPDPVCTPGAVDPAVTQVNLATTICRPGGYTNQAGVRNVTTATRAKVLRAYGYDPAKHFPGEVDHLISLQLGGSNEAKNLWPERGKVPNAKDAVENRLHRDVCAGRITLKAAQQKIAKDWHRA